MYQVYVNNRVVFENGVEDFPLTQASLDMELGKTGSFAFTIHPNHPNFAAVEIMAFVLVRREYETIYRGRVLDIQYGFYGEKQVSCEGELAFLLDSMIAPHSYTGDFSGYLPYIVGLHNNLVDEYKQFVSGAVTVGDYYPFSVTEDTEYHTALDILNNKMVQPSGGYLQVRYENGYRYLDLLSPDANAANVSGQTIELGKNLLDISREMNGENMFSAIVPLGAKLEGSEKRLDITSVNSGLPYLVNSAAVTLCKGKIYRKVIFDKITNAETLKAEATSYLGDNYTGEYSIEVTAADLSGIDPTIDHFRVGQWVRVYSEKHFGYTPQLFLIKKVTVNILKPAENKITIGKVKKGFAEEVAGISNSVESIHVPDVVQPYVMESGSTGIWNWKKFSDNTCEFFGKVPVLDGQTGTAFGGWYRSGALYDANAYQYPVDMTEAPAVQMIFQTRNANGAFLWPFSADAETARQYLPQCYLVKPTAATGILGNINIIGKGIY